MARTKAFDEQATLDKAVALFWKKGYNATSMQDLVDHLGISRSSIYETYGDKHALFIAALERYHEKFSQGVIQLLERSSSFRVTLEQILASMIQEIAKDPDHSGCFMVNSTTEIAPHDAEVARIARDNQEKLEAAFQKALEQAQARGELPKDKDPVALARFFFNTITGLRVAGKLGVKREVFEDIARVALSVLD